MNSSILRRSRWTDQRMEEIIARLLHAGITLSALVVLGGGIVYLFRHGLEPVNYRTFRGEPAELKSIRGIFKSVAFGDGRGLIQAGLLLLIATPVARVAFSIWGFAAEGDRMYTVFTVIVLAILVYSLV
jgi:uncharacterized membrane protein